MQKKKTDDPARLDSLVADHLHREMENRRKLLSDIASSGGVPDTYDSKEWGGVKASLDKFAVSCLLDIVFVSKREEASMTDDERGVLSKLLAKCGNFDQIRGDMWPKVFSYVLDCVSSGKWPNNGAAAGLLDAALEEAADKLGVSEESVQSLSDFSRVFFVFSMLEDVAKRTAEDAGFLSRLVDSYDCVDGWEEETCIDELLADLFSRVDTECSWRDPKFFNFPSGTLPVDLARCAFPLFPALCDLMASRRDQADVDMVATLVDSTAEFFFSEIEQAEPSAMPSLAARRIERFRVMAEMEYPEKVEEFEERCVAFMADVADAETDAGEPSL